MNLRLMLFKDSILFGSQRKQTTRTFIASLFSITIALIVALLVATMLGYNPLNIFVKLFTVGFTDYKTLFYYIGIFAISGLAFAMTSRAGIFNIGISGQMLGAGTCVVFFIKLLNDLNVADKIPNGVGQIIILAIAMLAGALFALFIGALDVYLKVNSVVSSILFNWVIFFVSFFLLATYAPGEGSILTNSILIPDNFRLISNSTGTGGLIPIIVIVLIVSIFMFLLFKFTVFGHKIKSVGLSLDASTYAGYKIKTIKLSTFAMSGAISGILACILYTSGFVPAIPLNTSVNAIPTEGFEGIAISLIANNNPIGIIAVGSLFSLFKNSMVGIVIPPSYINVLIGLIMLGAAISVVVIKWKPWSLLKTIKYKSEYYKVQEDYNNKHNALISKYKSIVKYEKINAYKQNVLPWRKKKLWKETLKEIKQDYLVEKGIIKTQFNEAKLKLLIDSRLDIEKVAKNKLYKRKHEIDIQSSKKIVRYQDRINSLQIKINNQNADRVKQEEKIVELINREIKRSINSGKLARNAEKIKNIVNELNDQDLVAYYNSYISNLINNQKETSILQQGGQNGI